MPGELNERLIALGVKCDLGMPIKVRDDCVGVAWVKYDEESPQPSRETVSELTGFAGQAGTVMDCLRHRLELLERDSVDEFLGGVQQELFPSGDVKLPGLEGYVICQPYRSPLGGDFYSTVKLDDQTAGVLLGDGEGKGIHGALPMLAMVTAFRAFCRDSASTAYVLGKLLSVAFDVGVRPASEGTQQFPPEHVRQPFQWGKLRGTVIYFIVAKMKDYALLIASAAGHPPLMIMKDDGENWDFPTSACATGPLVGAPPVYTGGQESRQIAPGDLIIAYTDGAGERAHIVEAVTRHISENPETIAKAIIEQVPAPAEAPPDDATVMVLRVL